MSETFKINKLTATFDDESDGKKALYKVELRDLARGFCGALFLALPLHYTMEMWSRAKVISPQMMLLFIIITYFVNVGFSIFSGYKPTYRRRLVWFDAVVSMAIGFVASAITLLLIDQLSWSLETGTMMKMISLQMIPTSFGASLAKSQLGSKKSIAIDDVYSDDFKKILGSFLGAVMFSFNIAATQEPIIICTSIEWYQIVILIFYSLAVSWLMVFIACFVERDSQNTGIMSDKWAETVICYVLSLFVSASLLYLFGHLTSDTPLYMAFSWIVVLGYCTSLGSSVGRIVIS